MKPPPRLQRDFYRRDPVTVARALLGQRLVHVSQGVRVAGLIVETEAYLGHIDKAAHSFNGRKTQRTQTMFADGGTAYVFLNYGIHHLLNIVVAGVEQPLAVLLRAVEPTEGLDAMYQRRSKSKKDTDLCSGPGKLGAAFGIDLSHDGVDLVENRSLFVEQLRQRAMPKRLIETTTRVGVDYAEEWAAAPLRFYLKGNQHVSVR
ncbi:DNA-3-methyladenine glycosylase [Algisphaera agarilytica]|uniref:Putative 3-methyladenine DNA glycosylase n=1 Tax=Algisphaera agarilytica TaxID=1385975 RepID=A0A7X0LLS2_9BACT|nr:DNA-3-methyladenine glycosylase [Algisphaera agarilytica]MBB6430921.1 DNA-3-methyladenine glycosylase [Algisphaera agarilytica]